MPNITFPKLGAATGAVFAIGLTVAAGNGDQSFSGPRAVAGIAAITLAYPFVAYVSRLLRDADGPGSWLATTALAGGLAGITLKLMSGIPELAIHRAGIADGTQLHKVLEAMADGTTVLSLYPLAVFCAATASVGLRTRVMPRWLSAGAGMTAAALAVNGAFLDASFVPALLLFLVWTLVASVYLVLRGSHGSARVAREAAAAA